MPFTLASGFAKSAKSNRTDKVGYVHLYYNDVNFFRLATRATEYGGYQYLPAVESIGSYTQEWRLLDENNVTNGVPEITLNEYTTQDGYSLQAEFGTYQFSGKKITILFGYFGDTDAHVPFIGFVDDLKWSGDKCTITLRSRDLPKTEIQGRKLTFKDQKVGGATIAGLKIPETSDGQYLPVPFGSHWNAPLTFYDDNDGEQSWCNEDTAWWASINNAANQVSDRFRHNTRRTEPIILIPSDGQLCPIHSVGFANNATLLQDQDARVSNLQRVLLYKAGTSDAMMNEGEIIVNVPLKIDRNGSTPSYNNIASHDADADTDEIFDGDGSTTFQLVADAVATNHYVQLADCRLDLKLNIRNDSRMCVHPSWKIHIPPEEGDRSITHLLGRQLRSGVGSSNIQMSAHAYYWNGTSWVDIGRTDGNNDADLGYNFGTYTGLTNLTGWTLINWSDPPTVGFHDDELADAGNSSGTLTDAMGNYPFLFRSALDRLIKIVFKVTWDGSSHTMTIYNCHLESVNVIEIPRSGHLYTELDGVKLSTVESIELYSRPSGTTGTYQLQRPIQYLEAIIRAKLGATDTNFSSVYSGAGYEWTDADEIYYEFFGPQRDKSGFVLYERTEFDKFLKEYVQHEPFSVYVDQVLAWRCPQLFIDADTAGSLTTIETVDFNDCTSFETGLTPLQNIIAEIKALKTDYIYETDEYAEVHGWKLDSGVYDYDYWKSDNTEDGNSLFIEEIAKKYTSAVEPDRVTAASGKVFGCVRSHINVDPDTDTDYIYWYPLAGTSAQYGTPSAWSGATNYKGCDAENFHIAKRKLNQHANRHNTVKFTTSKMWYFTLEINSVLRFENVPYRLNGMTINGFNGDTSTGSVSVNGQDAFDTFVVYKVTRDPMNVNCLTVECMQMHDLAAYTPVRVN